jgi:tRNA threonylcarbamoyladenosine biosynthesis protein TsaB
MRVLALDTTTRTRSAALVEGGRIVVERQGDSSRSHAECLPGDLIATLGEAGAAWASVELFAVAAGPGSFTGLRIGIATMQGLAFVNGRRMAAVSVLEALALAAGRSAPGGSVVGVWIDAYRRDVFSALYRIGGPVEPDAGGLADLVELDPPAVGPPAATLARWQRAHPPPHVVIGDGATQYAHVLRGHARAEPRPPLAGLIGLIAARRARAGDTSDPAGVQPLYIRRPDAELAREREALRNSPSP